jgi:hypothetical protein
MVWVMWGKLVVYERRHRGLEALAGEGVPLPAKASSPDNLSILNLTLILKHLRLYDML